MLVQALSAITLYAALSSAAPTGLLKRVTLNAAAVAEAQVRDNTATRAFTAVSITTSDGSCLFVDPLSGDFRENLTPVQTAKCDGSTAQQWDVITKGKHNNKLNSALIVNTLTNACLNFDPRRVAGDQVNLFSCGGRADGSGAVTDSQLFQFTGSAGPLPLLPENGQNKICLTVVKGRLDQTACNPASASGSELFKFGKSAGAGSGTPPKASNTDSTPPPKASVASAATIKANNVASAASTKALTSSSAASAAVVTSNPAVKTGTKLNLAAVAEAMARDNTATRAVSGAPIKAADGSCFFVDPTSGDFRENLIPIQTAKCDGSPAQQWDVITKGIHNNKPGSALIVSSLTQGCLNFDDRRAPGNQVLLFACGGRADGSGEVNDSQLFPFDGTKKTIPLAPLNGKNAICFAIASNGLLDKTSCNPASLSANELFTIG
ncbi:hypothetical protein GALMADRAFT_246727 [Galerina marginata CBS 339.88]|uniref:Ricin B lectin domain-containing protein n=1 Tax=Galerina marginata (strain CBS 339.88) TaxID=685588 RepID=A0A067T2D2_GALM3|nr:hypothetical protein GALMADRAFT_246727 [Galerina marginata CBS 339.88]